MQRVQRVQRVFAPRRPPAAPETADERSLARDATRRISRRQVLGSALLDAMEEERNFVIPEEKKLDLPAPVIERTEKGGEPLDEWKPILLENEVPEGAPSVPRAASAHGGSLQRLSILRMPSCSGRASRSCSSTP